MRRKHIRNSITRLLTEYGISEPPVDVVRIATGLGLEIQKKRAEEGLSGFLLREGGASPVIAVNCDEHPNRQRFTIAHEIGHFLLHTNPHLHVDRGYMVKLRDTKSSEGTDLEEKEANLFAAELLMPEHFVSRDVSSTGTVDLLDEKQIGRLAQQYKVSPQAFAFRLAYLGYS
jgi:Zn-dependent peptidase ImmA (M78 family)